MWLMLDHTSSSDFTMATYFGRIVFTVNMITPWTHPRMMMVMMIMIMKSLFPNAITTLMSLFPNAITTLMSLFPNVITTPRPDVTWNMA